MDVLCGGWSVIIASFKYPACTVPCWQMRSRWIKHRESLSVMSDSVDVLSGNNCHKHPSLGEHRALQPSAKPPARHTLISKNLNTHSFTLLVDRKNNFRTLTAKKGDERLSEDLSRKACLGVVKLNYLFPATCIAGSNNSYQLIYSFVCAT